MRFSSLIRVDSNPMRQLSRDYLERVMAHLEANQEEVKTAWSSSFSGAGIDELTPALMEPLRQFQHRIFSFGPTP